MRQFALVAVFAATAPLLFAQGSASNPKPLFSADDKVWLDKELANIEALNKAGEDQKEAIHNASKFLASKWTAPIMESAAAQVANGKAGGNFEFDKGALKKQLGKELGQERLGKIRAIYERNLESKDAQVRRHAVWWFAKIDPDIKSRARIKELLRSKDLNVRFESARQLAEEKDHSGEIILESELESRDVARSLDAASALARLGNVKARDRANQIYRSTTSFSIVRANAIPILARFHSAESDLILVSALDESDPMIVAAALGHLMSRGIRLKQNNIRRLFQIIDDKAHSRDAKEMAVSVLWSNARDDSGLAILPEFIRRLGSDDLATKLAAIQGVIAFGGKGNVKSLIPLLDSQDVSVKRRAEVGLGKFTGIQFGQNSNDINLAVASRKEWWAQHANDPEYR